MALGQSPGTRVVSVSGINFYLLFTLLVLMSVCGPCLAAISPVLSVAALRAGNFGDATSLFLAGYYAGSTTGGGQLILEAGNEADDACTTFVDQAGHHFRRNPGNILNVTMCGARCGGMQVTDGHSTSSSAVITSASARWSSAMAGWRAVVDKAGPSGRQIDTTIIAARSGSLTLGVPAAMTNSGETVSVYPDDTKALDAAFAVGARLQLPVQLPSKAICGYANPGSSVYKTTAAPALELNSGTLWLGHTGPSTDSGVGLYFAANGAAVIGPGTISGLYQTDQNAPQFNTAAILFRGTSGNAIRDHVTIENTKGRAFLADQAKDFSVTDVVVRNCGDFAYQHGTTPYDQTGRSMCGQVTQPLGTLRVTNYTGINAAQSGFLLFGPTARSFHATIQNCHFSGNGYYGLDLEEVFGTLELSDCEQTGNGKKPAGVLVYGGYVMRDIENFSARNIESKQTNSNAFVLESTDSRSNISNWSIDGLNVTGTVQHAGSIYLAFAWAGAPNQVSLNNVTYDAMTIYAASPACNQAGPAQQILTFNNIRASGFYQGGPQTAFTPQGNPNQVLYVRGRDSNLGKVSFKPIGANQNAIFFDLAGVQSTPVLPAAKRPFKC